MEARALKIDLHDKIDHADADQIKELYCLIINYFNGNELVKEENSLSESQKNILYKSLEQADAGLGTPLKDINNKLRAKYNLNG